MKAKITRILRGFLMIWGGLSLIWLITSIGVTMYGLHSAASAMPAIDGASLNDVRFVLNWSDLGEKRAVKVLHSYVSARSFTGDHEDAYAIQISHVDVSELKGNQDPTRRHWYRGDQLPPPLDEAVTFASRWHHDLSWLPSEAQLRSHEMYVYANSIQLDDMSPSAVELIFVRPADNMVFYLEVVI